MGIVDGLSKEGKREVRTSVAGEKKGTVTIRMRSWPEEAGMVMTRILKLTTYIVKPITN